MIEALARLLGRLPEPIVTLVPILLAFLGPGLVLALVAISVRVPYPQETMASYAAASVALPLPAATSRTRGAFGQQLVDD